MPERVHRLCGVKSPHRVQPSLFRQSSKGAPALWLNQRVLVPRLRSIDVVISWNDVVVAREHYGYSCGQKFGAVRQESPQPSELVIKFWTGLRVPVGRIKRSDDDPIYCRFDVPALGVGWVAGQLTQGLDRFPFREDGDPVPCLLTSPDRLVSRVFDCLRRKLSIRRLEFLQADDVWASRGEPVEKVREPAPN